MTFNFNKQTKPIIISGPCSAETEDQLYTTAEQLSNIKQVSILRAGIWKPRTRPGNFEGVGKDGLKWLVNAGRNYNFKTTTEVANAIHVDQALKAGVDILWIGARTTVNPFAVQEIVNVLKGQNIPVMIKNPINPDLQLWVGAIERFLESGISNLAVIHRGFSSYEKSNYRNDPKWGIPIELMSLFPDIPIICDPSHIGGDRSLIQSISQKALDMNMNGLMIETHFTPDKAWSDAQQQITPKALKQILSQLVIRQRQPSNPEFISKLDQLRAQIDEIDNNVLETLAQRFKLIEKIGAYKKENNTTILQPDRWLEILKSRKEFGKSLELNDEFIDQLLKLIHKESVSIQTKIMNR